MYGKVLLKKVMRKDADLCDFRNEWSTNNKRQKKLYISTVFQLIMWYPVGVWIYNSETTIRINSKYTIQIPDDERQFSHRQRERGCNKEQENRLIHVTMDKSGRHQYKFMLNLIKIWMVAHRITYRYVCKYMGQCTHSNSFLSAERTHKQ